MIAPLLLLTAALSAAQTPPAVSSEAAPAEAASARTVTELKQDLLSATNDAERGAAVDQLSRTAPVSAQDVSALFDLFSRYPNPQLRAKVMASLALIAPDSPELEPLFVTYLQQPDPAEQMFGINGAFRLHSRLALPLVRKIAERKITPDTSPMAVLHDRLIWSTQYEALSALSQWEPEKTYPLLLRQSETNPDLGYLLGLFYWRQTLPELPKWIRSSHPVDQQKALEAASAKIEPEDARATRAQMLVMLNDPTLDKELRRRLALKVGLSSTDAEVDALIRAHDAAPDEITREVWATAVFVSRSPHAVPLLVRYAKTSPKPSFRNGARAELVELVGESKADELLGEKKDAPKVAAPAAAP